MEHLNELIATCRAADTDKVTERKKQIDKLKILIDKPYVRKALNSCSDTKQRSGKDRPQFGWDSLFKVVKNLLRREAESIQKAKDSQSTASLKKKQDVCSLFKLVVKLANKGGKHLKAADVIEHVINVLNDDFTKSIFGNDHSSILLKDILSVRLYWSQVDSKLWQTLLGVYTQMLTESPPVVGRDITARVILATVLAATDQCKVRLRKPLPIFEKYFETIRHEKSNTVMENILSAVNKLCEVQAEDARVQICRFGEAVCVHLLYVWNSRPSDRLKVEMIRFYQLQMTIHHPNGALDSEHGAFAVDWELWKSNRRKLYEAVYNDLENIRNRTLYSSSGKEHLQATIPEPFVNLAVDICHQLFVERTSVIDVTQLSTSLGAPAKKRRIESGWGLLRDAINQNSTSYSSVPWLQLLGTLIQKYPKSVPEEEFFPILSMLQQVFVDSKKPEITKHVLACLVSMAMAQVALGNELSHQTVEICKDVWRKVWACSLRIISLRHAENEGFRLLSTLLDCGLVTPEREMWSLYIPTVQRPSESAVKFLNTYVSKRDLPEKFRPRSLVSFDVDSSQSEQFPLRRQLIQWAFPVRSSDLEEGVSVKVTAEIVNPCILARCLVMLTLRNPDLCQGLDFCESANVAGNILCDISNSYLATCFDKSDPPKSGEGTAAKKAKEASCIAHLQKFLFELLKQESSDIIDVSCVEVSYLQSVISHVCLISEVLKLLVQLQLMTVEELPKCEVFGHMKTLLDNFARIFADILLRDTTHQYVSLLPSLRILFNWTIGDQDLGTYNRTLSQQTAELMRCVIPGKLVNSLLDLALDKMKRRKSVSSEHLSAKSFSRKASNTSIGFDDFDMDFDRTNNMDIDLDDLDSTRLDSQDSSQGSSQDQTSGTQSIFARSQLSEPEDCRLQAVEILTQFCAHGKGQDTENNNVVQGLDMELSSVSDSVVSEKLMDLLDETDWDPSRPFDLQVLRALTLGMCCLSRTVSDNEIQMIQDSIRTVCMKYRRNQEVCRVVLELLAHLIPQLGDEDGMSAPWKDDARPIVMSMHQAFWKMSEKPFVQKTQNALANFMRTLIQCDPDARWTTSESRGENDEREIVTVRDQFPRLLEDRHQGIRLAASREIYCLFNKEVDGKLEPLPKEDQDAAFENIYTVLQGVIAVEGRSSPDEQKDEILNRTSSVLHVLANIACSSTICEKKALFAFCQMAKDNNFDIDLVQKVLLFVANHRGYKELRAYLTSHVPYILHEWQESGYKIWEFPHDLTGFHSKADFLKAHISAIIPLLVTAKDTESLKALQEPLNSTCHQLVMNAIPQILIHILPVFAIGKVPELAARKHVQKRQIQANSSYEYLTKIVEKGDIERSIVTNLEDIVVQLLLTLKYSDNDKEAEFQMLKCCPEPNPPSYDRMTIEATLRYLTEGLATQAKTLVGHLSKSNSSIQQILLELSVHLSGARATPEQYRVLLMYQLFVQLLLEEFGAQLGGSWAFVLQDVIYTLLHVIQKTPVEKCSSKGFESALVCLSVRLLHNVCRVAVECCSEEMGRFLPVIVRTLVSRTSMIDDIGHQCTVLINFLIVESHKELGAFIRHLDPLPESDHLAGADIIRKKLKYAKGRFSLAQEVEHFLQSFHQTSTGSSMQHQCDTLKFFHKILTNDKAALRHMIRDPQSSASQNLVLFVYKLLQLAKSTNQEEAELAGKCLGEIGPLNIPAISVKEILDNSALQVALLVYNDDSKQQRYCWVFHMLGDYLKDPSIKTVVAASGVLKQTLATKTGITFSSNYKNRIDDCLFQYLHPFKTSRKSASSSTYCAPSVESVHRDIDQEDLWLPTANHKHWLRHLVSTLIGSGVVSDEVLRLLSPICEVKVDFCHKILPFIIHDMLQQQVDVYREILNKHINGFFKYVCKQPKNGGIQYQESTRTMLSVVLYLRQQERSATGRRQATAWDNNFWLDLDYLPIAQAAHDCASHFTAILFSEIWCDVQRDKLRQMPGLARADSYSDSQSSRSTSQTSDAAQMMTQGSQLETLSNLPNSADLSVQCLMLEAYRCVGDTDAMYGCGAGRLSDTVSRIKTYQQEGSWHKALGSYDLELGQTGSGSVSDPQLGLLQALQNCGCAHVLDVYLRGLPPQSLEGNVTIKDLQYEAAWRNTNWDMDVPTRLDDSLTFNQALYTSLVAIKDKDLQVASAASHMARLGSLTELSLSSLKCTRNVYPTLRRLHCVAQAEDVQAVFRGKLTIADLLEKWRAQDSLLRNDFREVEPVLVERCILLEVAQNRSKMNVELRRGQVSLWEQLAKSAREAGRMQVAERAVHHIRCLDSQHAEGRMWSWRVEEAWLFWSRGERDTAKHLMKSLIPKLEKMQDENSEAATLYPKCLGIYGNWLAETRSESPNIVMDQYLKKATDLLEASNSQDESALDAFMSLGRYADGQYQNIVNYMKSSTYEAKQELVLKAKRDAEQLRSIGDKTSRYLRILEKQGTIDEQELSSLQEDRNRFLECALHNYLKCLQAGDKHDLRVFRLTSLWFENSSLQEVNTQLKNGLPKIKSQKFLSLMYQLAARMSRKPQSHGDLFKPTLDKLIERTTLDHPHHTLPIILALANANKDTEVVQAKGSRKSTGRLGRGAADSQEDTEEDRVLAAKAMVDRLLSSFRAGIIQDMNRLCLAYIVMANWNVEKYKKETRPINIPNTLAITQMKNLENVAVPTVETKVDPSCEYKNIVYVKGFQPTFKLAGGINLPKIISCVGSDGVSRRQLVKGKDDLRQDAVMQQVFSMVNNLLYKDPDTRKRRLSIRTYKVIPLSQRSGLLEWCEGTVPMGDYLIAPQTGAHEKYRPQDWRAKDCRTAMAEAHASGNLKTKYTKFMAACQKFKPVFRHFFMEKFPDPADWYERRLAYTHSVATNSIVGYILGLGDRHVQNILIDTKTAEMVHIDLGVAFEQGRILPTPETVPFRLTRDVVDGMGVAGVEGVFRRSCEKTMEVMRGSHEALLTILQVLLYDPLYAWTMSPERAYMLQHRRDQEAGGDGNATRDILDIDEPAAGKSDSTESVNRVAERVLLRLQQKLQGVEDGVPLSVSGQVNLLIQQARDPKNLCRLFPGWQPYI